MDSKKEVCYPVASDLPPAYDQNHVVATAPPPPEESFSHAASTHIVTNTQSVTTTAAAAAETPALATINGPQQSQAKSFNDFSIPVGPKSVEMNCPKCQCHIHTKVRHQPTAKTHIASILLAWTLCGCFLPYVIKSCQNTDHYCPGCNYFIGTYKC